MNVQFTIDIQETSTSVRVQAPKGTDPAEALRRAVAALTSEQRELAACPAHSVETMSQTEEDFLAPLLQRVAEALVAKRRAGGRQIRSTENPMVDYCYNDGVLEERARTQLELMAAIEEYVTAEAPDVR